MPNGVVIDGHLIPEISKELNDGSGTLVDIWNWLIVNCGIVVNDQIEQFWQSHCTRNYGRNIVFWTQYDACYGTTIREVEPKTLSEEDKRKLVEFGMPKDLHIMATLKTAEATNNPRYILAEHISYFEPSAPQDIEFQKKIISQRNGYVCKYLEKSIKVRVGDRKDCISHFEIANGNCKKSCLSEQVCLKAL